MKADPRLFRFLLRRWPGVNVMWAERVVNWPPSIPGKDRTFYRKVVEALGMMRQSNTDIVF